MNAPCFPITPTTGVRVITQVFRVSGPYMPSPGLVTAVVEAVGGGGGGAGVGGLAATQAGSGGGGGSGGYSRIALAASLLIGGVSVAVGSGGAATNGGAPGSATSFGALCVANGGFGGQPATPTEWGGGGLGANPGIGDVAFPGNWGGNGFLITGLPAESVGMEAGMGAASVFGGSTRGGFNPGLETPGVAAAPNTGAGGTGGWSSWFAQGGLAVPGGAGGSGICIVTEYCTLTGGGGCGCGSGFGPARVAYSGWRHYDAD